jgi:hypothetical protein
MSVPELNTVLVPTPIPTSLDGAEFFEKMQSFLDATFGEQL